MKIDSDVFDEKTPEMLKDLAALIAESAAKDYAMPTGKSKQLGIDVAMRIADEWGGIMVYIPTASGIKISLRDMQIYRRFNGYNHDALAKEYGVSVQWVYQVLKRVRKQQQDKQQRNLDL